MVEVAVGRVKEELLLLELVAKLDGTRMGRASVGLCPQGKLLCEAHFVSVGRVRGRTLNLALVKKG
jgi:hypothetical protein